MANPKKPIAERYDSYSAGIRLVDGRHTVDYAGYRFSAEEKTNPSDFVWFLTD
jgi:hypothetical protein